MRNTETNIVYQLRLLPVLASLILIAACSQGGKNDTAGSTIVSVSASCSPATIQAGQTSQCSATVVGSGKFSSNVTWTASAGSISSSGLYTPPTVPATTSANITAASAQDPTKSDSTTITLLRFGSP